MAFNRLISVWTEVAETACEDSESLLFFLFLLYGFRFVIPQ
jgi:hypothetical protein